MKNMHIINQQSTHQHLICSHNILQRKSLTSRSDLIQMSNEIKTLTRLSLSDASSIPEAQSAQYCHINHRTGSYDSKSKEHAEEDVALIRLKRMALNLEKAMIFKQQRLHRLTKTTKTSCKNTACTSSSSMGKRKGSATSMHRTSRLRDAAPITPRRQLSNDLLERSQDVDDKWKDQCSAAAKVQMNSPRRCNSDYETLIKLIEGGALTCGSDRRTDNDAFHVSAPELHYSFTFPKSLEATTFEHLPNDDSSTDSSVSSVNSVTTSSCESDKFINYLYSGHSARTPTYKILQKVEEMGGDDKSGLTKATLKSTASQFSSLFLNDEDVSITSVSSSSTIRASNRSP